MLNQNQIQHFAFRCNQQNSLNHPCKGELEDQNVPCQAVKCCIDVLVVLKSLVNPGVEIKNTGKAIVNLSLDYEVVISCVFMNETQYQTSNRSLPHNIRKEGILL